MPCIVRVIQRIISFFSSIAYLVVIVIVVVRLASLMGGWLVFHDYALFS